MQENGELKVQQFPSGFSNLTYLIEFAGTDYVLRPPNRPPFGANIKSGHDMGHPLTEYKILSALEGNYYKAPNPFFFVMISVS